jgi:hypothetical protein
VKIMAGTVYQPGSGQTYFSKAAAQPKKTAVQPAVQGGYISSTPTGPTAQSVVSQQMTAAGIPPGTMTMGPSGYMNGDAPQGGFLFTNQPAGGIYNGVQSNGALGMATNGPTVYAPGGDVYGGQGNGPTVYAPTTTSPSLSRPVQKSSFMSLDDPALQGRTTVIPNTSAIPRAGAAAGGSVLGGAGSGSAGVAGKPSDYSSIIGMLKSAQDAANAANQARLDEIMNLNQTAANESLRQSRVATQGNLAANTADMISRGLVNSTVLDTNRRGILNDANARDDAIRSNLAQTRAGVLERVSDEGPDLGLYAQLLSQPGGADIASAILQSMQPTKKKGK